MRWHGALSTRCFSWGQYALPTGTFDLHPRFRRHGGVIGGNEVYEARQEDPAKCGRRQQRFEAEER
ncbi:MAG: hypothetical protein BJ554DRAFT_5949 [Olpidium bornovanus]|uniref:Uncharacterized protein n=1 Tax=Olpidium bornovanus TaxID=278681 RepID=A0A8H7ZYP1_9FUNG|nr:MAG: hypothetical protein BJ554DRAFT_5949 [Olpidium bornovanus]